MNFRFSLSRAAIAKHSGGSGVTRFLSVLEKT